MHTARMVQHQAGSANAEQDRSYRAWSCFGLASQAGCGHFNPRYFSLHLLGCSAGKAVTKTRTTNHKRKTSHHKPQTINHKSQTTNHKPPAKHHKPQAATIPHVANLEPLNANVTQHPAGAQRFT